MLKFEVVPTRVLKEHGPLLTRLTFESERWGNDKRCSGSFEIVGKCVELGLAENGSKMRDWHFVSIYRIIVVSTAVALST